ncbi:hypothetical protein [Streptosporangium carneum]|uniref:Band 7 domain-containing protein n=1 Tax=Streptosporangium carneum TaxID=47481 RepID=A0A9W6MA73_9ACTN|nr:hypothetical protein [Streptosporangium carneum]GLK06717.1 hypothetical protein GCM10017600_01220 [Streptosporangium carneum]
MPALSGYPIVEERSLRPPQRRLGLFTRRDLHELPETPVGTVLVFAVNGGYKAYTEGEHLRGSEEAVVRARSVSVVYLRSRQVVLTVEIPSQDMGYHFQVKATFTCKVTDPEAVVAAGVEDAATILGNHLRDDAGLMRLGMSRPVEDVHLLSIEVTSRVRAYLEFCPPRMDGLEVALVNVALLPPNDILAHGQRLKQLKWSGESKELEWAIENRDVSRIEEIFKRGVEATTAFGVSRDQLLMPDAVGITREAQETRMKALSELINRLPDGSLDFLPIDTQRLIDRVMTSIVGEAPFVEAPENAGRLGIGEGGAFEDRTSGDRDAGPRRIGLEDLDD